MTRRATGLPAVKDEKTGEQCPRPVRDRLCLPDAADGFGLIEQYGGGAGMSAGAAANLLEAGQDAAARSLPQPSTRRQP
jgi:hypothetical protein